jgi:hypothetical protein
MEYNIGCGDMINEYHPVIGKTIYLRSPITCSSAAKGLGICRHCYGELFSINREINIGKTAAEEFSSRLTQQMLSAKHLLEAKISSPEWCNDIDDFLNIEEGMVSINPNISKRCYLVIERDDIQVETLFSLSDDDESDDDFPKFKEFINSFTISFNKDFDSLPTTCCLKYKTSPFP